MTLSTKTLTTGRNTSYPPCFEQSRLNDLVHVDGVTRGTVWDGTASAAKQLGIDPPLAAPTLTDDSGGTTYTYYDAFRWVDTTGNRWTYSALSALASTTAGATSGVNYTHTLNSSSLQSRVNCVEIFRSTAGQSTVVYKVYGTGFTATVNSVANSGGYAKYTTSAAHGFVVGDIVVGPSPYAYEQTVTGVDTTTTFTTDGGYTATTTGTVTQRVYTFGHNGTWTTITSNGAGTPKCRFTVAAGHKLAINAKILVANSSVGGYNTTHTISAVTATTFDTDINYSSDESDGGTWTLTGFIEALADSTFTAATWLAVNKLPILTERGYVFARRQEPPPKHMSVAAEFLDRMWYAVPLEYSVGTITTNGTRTIEFSGNNAYADFVDRFIAIEGETQLYKLSAYTDANTMLVDKVTATSSAGLAYTIFPDPEEFSKVYWTYTDEPESALSTDHVIVQNNTALADRNTGLIPYGGALYVTQRHHVYRLTMAYQGHLRVTPTLVASRGCINHRCHKQHESSIYLLDAFGIWALTGGGGWDPLSPPLQDIFRDGDLDWSKSRWWHCEVDAEEEVIRWFVNFTDANFTKPNRVLAYHLRSKDWWTETRVHEIGGCCRIRIGGRMRVLEGGMNEQIYLTNQGTADGTTSATTHTATGGTTTTATGSSLGSTVNASIAFLTGANKGLARRITINNGSTITFTPALDSAVASGDQFVIGGIPWNVRTGRLGYVERDEAVPRALRVTFNPTTNAATFDARMYRDHSDTADSSKIAVNQGWGTQTTADAAGVETNMKLSRSALGDTPGTAWFPVGDGRLDPYTQHDRWVSWELKGVQHSDRIEIYEMEVHGVE